MRKVRVKDEDFGGIKNMKVQYYASQVALDRYCVGYGGD